MESATVNPTQARRRPLHHPIRERLLVVVSLTVLVASGLIATAVPPPSLAAEDPTWHGEYFANPPSPARRSSPARTTPIDFDWGAGSPDPACRSTSSASAGPARIDLAAGTYRFTTTTDDGVRLYVDGQLKIDHWVDQAPTEWQADVPLTAGEHTVVMEYYENGWGAVARLTLQHDPDRVSRPAPGRASTSATRTWRTSP